MKKTLFFPHIFYPLNCWHNWRERLVKRKVNRYPYYSASVLDASFGIQNIEAYRNETCLLLSYRVCFECEFRQQWRVSSTCIDTIATKPFVKILKTRRLIKRLHFYAQFTKDFERLIAKTSDSQPQFEVTGYKN